MERSGYSRQPGLMLINSITKVGLNLVADDAVPLTKPWWTFQAGDAGIRYDHMITCLLEGMLKSSHIHVNYN